MKRGLYTFLLKSCSNGFKCLLTGLVLLVPGMLVTAVSFGQSIGTWAFSNTTTGTGATNNTVSTADFSSFIPTHSFNGGTEYYGEGGWPSGNINLNSYLEFNLTPNTSYALNIASIALTIRRSNTGTPSGSGPTKWSLRSSLDGFTTDIAGDTLIYNYATFTISPGSAFLNLPTGVHFRLYGHHDITNSGGSSRLVVDNIRVNGLSALLPATIGSFTAALQNNQPQIRCSLLNASPGDRLYVERSVNGNSFSGLEEIAITENTVVQGFVYADSAFPPASEILYYRLRLESAGGQRWYSAIIPVSLQKRSGRLPFLATVKGNCLSVTPLTAGQGAYQVCLYTTDGRIMAHGSMTAGNTGQPVSFPLRFAAPGACIVNITGPATQFSTLLMAD